MELSICANRAYQEILPAVQLDDNLAGAVVVNLLELSDITFEAVSMLRKIKRVTSSKKVR